MTIVSKKSADHQRVTLTPSLIAYSGIKSSHNTGIKAFTAAINRPPTHLVSSYTGTWDPPLAVPFPFPKALALGTKFPPAVDRV